MNKFNEFIHKPVVWIYISIIYIWFYITAKVLASLAPLFLISKIADTDNSLSFLELKKAFLIYVQEGANEAGINTQYFLYSIVTNIIILIPILVVGILILRKKLWARNVLIVLLILLIFMPSLLSAFTSEVSLNILNYDTLIYLAIIYMFTRKSTKEYFKKNT